MMSIKEMRKKMEKKKINRKKKKKKLINETIFKRVKKFLKFYIIKNIRSQI